MRRKAANWPSRNCLAEGGEARQATWTNSAQSHPLMYSVWRRSICATFGLWSWVIRRAWIRKSSPHKRLIGKVRRQEQEEEAGAEGRSRRQEQEAGAGGRSRRQEQEAAVLTCSCLLLLSPAVYCSSRVSLRSRS